MVDEADVPGRMGAWVGQEVFDVEDGEVGEGGEDAPADYLGGDS